LKRTITAVTLTLSMIILCSALNAHASNMKKMKDLKMIGIFLNHNEPGNRFDSQYDSDIAGGIRVGYGITDEIGAFFSFSNFKFDGRSTVSGRDTLSINCLQGNVFYKFNTPTKLHPFATVGGGYYMINDGIDDFGLNFGLGMMMDLPKWSELATLDLSWNYHRIASRKETDSVFTELRLGLSFNFF